jgi:BirA family transcriptional regulator, biotin operon repressor / biotin---[acetyl-CoA-carboxylase] ligase
MGTLDSGILKTLRAASQHIPAKELAAQLQTTPGHIAVRIAELRAAGYDIECHPHFGYRFIAAPDRLIADDLATMLDGISLAREVLVFENTGSTNDFAARMGRDGAAEGLVIFAESQTAGRGRLGRRWESDARKGLWFSLLLRPAFSPALWTRLTTWAAVAIAEAVEAKTGCKTDIKWPNDIYIGGKKVTGILIESHFDKTRGGFAVVGIGVNVNHEKFPNEIAERAGSLRLACGHPLDRQQLAAALFRRLDALYPLLKNDFVEIVARAELRSFLRGQWIEIRAGETVLAGCVVRLDADGGIVLRTGDGKEVSVCSGEVTVFVP